MNLTLHKKMTTKINKETRNKNQNPRGCPSTRLPLFPIRLPL